MSIDLSLERLQLAIQHLPKYTRPTCHIAGTNGKGSVTAIVSSILQSSSPPLKVGRYNSPHLISINDCIVINGQPVDPELYCSVRRSVGLVDHELGTKLTNFELLTLTALQLFECLGVDLAVVEVGMGGRLDATNIIPDEAILVSALTSVDLDHQAFLGNTVSDIAREKVGIARCGRPFVLGLQKYPEVVDVVKSTLREKNCNLVPPLVVQRISTSKVPQVTLHARPFQPPSVNRVSFHIPVYDEEITADVPLHGVHQVENLTTALTIISALLTGDSPLKPILTSRLSISAISSGINNTQWPGRLSFHTIHSPRPLSVLVDGAHNSASAKSLADYINWILSVSTDLSIDLVYVIALSHSPPKTPLETISPLLPPNIFDAQNRVKYHIAMLEFSPPEGMPWVKSVPPSDLARVVKGLVPDIDLWVADQNAKPGTSLSRAMEWAAGRIRDAGLVVVAGSLYLVSDFYRAFK